MFSTTDGWAVGDGGTLLHWNGTDWQEVDAGIMADLLAIDMISATEGWIVGDNNTILHWDGSSWTAQTSPVSKLVAVSMVSATEGWAVGENSGEQRLVSWNGNSWSVDSFTLPHEMNAIAHEAPGKAWSVGTRAILRADTVNNHVYLPFIQR